MQRTCDQAQRKKLARGRKEAIVEDSSWCVCRVEPACLPVCLACLCIKDVGVLYCLYVLQCFGLASWLRLLRWCPVSVPIAAQLLNLPAAFMDKVTCMSHISLGPAVVPSAAQPTVLLI